MIAGVTVEEDEPVELPVVSDDEDASEADSIVMSDDEEGDEVSGVEDDSVMESDDYEADDIGGAQHDNEEKVQHLGRPRKADLAEAEVCAQSPIKSRNADPQVISCCMSIFVPLSRITDYMGSWLESCCGPCSLCVRECMHDAIFVMQDFQQREEQREALKQQIAAAATKLLQDPEQNLEQLQLLVELIKEPAPAVSSITLDGLP